MAAHIALPQSAPESRPECPIASCRAFHSASERSRYFSVTISRIGPDVLRHAAVHQHQAVLKLAGASRLGTSLASRIVCCGSRRPRLMPNSGSPVAAHDALDQLDPGPHAARILPASARAAEPLPENRARRDQPPVLFRNVAGQRCESGPSPACIPRSGTPADWSRRPGAILSGYR